MKATKFTKADVEKGISDSYEIPNRVLEAIDNPVVSIQTSTYNQEKFIKGCIEGVVNQKTDFPFEYIIGEDFSTDKTREIVMGYAEKYPDIIRVITADYNIGSKANGRRCARACRGEFWALCEGDDYWSNPAKLQEQVDFLRSNPEYSGYCNNVEVLWDYGPQKGQLEIYNKEPQPDPLPLEVMVSRYVSQTASYCMRGVPDWVYDDWFLNLDAGDNALLWGMAMRGKVKYNHEPWSVWRKQQGTATSVVEANFFKHFSCRSELLMRFEEIYDVCLEKEKKIIFKSAVSSEIIRNPKLAIRRLLGAQYRKLKSIFSKG